jgi:hypothetical protein
VHLGHRGFLVRPSCTALYAERFILMDSSTSSLVAQGSRSSTSPDGPPSFRLCRYLPDIFFRLHVLVWDFAAPQGTSPSIDSSSLDYPQSATKSSAIFGDYLPILAITSAVSRTFPHLWTLTTFSDGVNRPVSYIPMHLRYVNVALLA